MSETVPTDHTDDTRDEFEDDLQEAGDEVADGGDRRRLLVRAAAARGIGRPGEADGSNYREAADVGSEPASGANYRETEDIGSEAVDGSNYREQERST